MDRNEDLSDLDMGQKSMTGLLDQRSSQEWWQFTIRDTLLSQKSHQNLNDGFGMKSVMRADQIDDSCLLLKGQVSTSTRLWSSRKWSTESHFLFHQVDGCARLQVYLQQWLHLNPLWDKNKLVEWVWCSGQCYSGKPWVSHSCWYKFCTYFLLSYLNRAADQVCIRGQLWTDG